MADSNGENGVRKIVPKKSHQELRYDTSIELARKAEACETLEELADHFEHALLAGEQKGVSAAIEYLMVAQVQRLRQSFASGPANHIEQAVRKLAIWADRSDNFKFYTRPEVIVDTTGAPAKKTPRKFFGMDPPKDE